MRFDRRQNCGSNISMRLDAKPKSSKGSTSVPPVASESQPGPEAASISRGWTSSSIIRFGLVPAALLLGESGPHQKPCLVHDTTAPSTLVCHPYAAVPPAMVVWSQTLQVEHGMLRALHACMTSARTR